MKICSKASLIVFQPMKRRQNDLQEQETISAVYARRARWAIQPFQIKPA